MTDQHQMVIAFLQDEEMEDYIVSIVDCLLKGTVIYSDGMLIKALDEDSGVAGSA